MRLERLLIGLTALAALVGCENDGPPGPDAGGRTGTLPPGLVISEPVRVVAGPGALAGLGESVLYVSASPGTFPDGVEITITNLSRDASVGAMIADGGFDPVALTAVPDDELEIAVRNRDGSIDRISTSAPRAKRPTVVRTRPAKDATDVALNASILVIFSEPIDPATVNPETIELLLNDLPAEGIVGLTEDGLVALFTAAALLAPQRTYTLVITTSVRDLEGDPLEERVEVPFSTGTSAAPIAAVTVSPDDAAIVVGAELQLRATAIDEAGNPLAVPRFTWSSSDDAIVTVNERGLVTGVGPGTASVTATAEGVSGTATITVIDADPLAIAFSSNRSGDFEIYAMPADGSVAVNLTRTSGWDTHPAWSPDGSKIAFSSGRRRWDVYVMNADGTGQVNLTNFGSFDSFGRWSPDGSKIAFTSSRDGNFEIYMMDADGSDPVNLSNHAEAHDTHPDWSPDGSKIAFASNRDGAGISDIFVMSADGSNALKLTNSGSEGIPVWSPDGSKLAFGSLRDGNMEIYVMNADGSNPVNLTNHPGPDTDPAWSPDGSKIVFASWRGEPVGGDPPYDIYVMNADGSGLTRLTTHPEIDRYPSWRP